jgi:hypothetical protein
LIWSRTDFNILVQHSFKVSCNPIDLAARFARSEFSDGLSFIMNVSRLCDIGIGMFEFPKLLDLVFWVEGGESVVGL